MSSDPSFGQSGGAPLRGAVLALAAVATLSSCNAQASDELLASELVYQAKGKAWNRSVEIDPWLASHPAIVRELRDSRISNMLAGDNDCYTENGTECEEIASFELDFGGTRLLSVYEETQVDTGGAHPRGVYRDHLIDLSTGQKIRFGDLFVSWTRTRADLQREFCKVVRMVQEDLQECPDIQKQAITLSSYRHGKVTSFIVHTQDYELGYYGAGNGPFQVDFPPHVLEQIKPEYRSEFDDPTW